MVFINFRNITFLLVLTLLTGGLSSCEVEDIPDPNGSSVENLLNNPSRSDLQTAITGTENLLRTEINFYHDVTGIIGREWYFFTGSDPRFTGEILGKGGSELDNAGFYGTRPYAARYATVKNTNIIIQAVTENANDLGLSSEEINGYTGFAKTIQAYELHLALNLQFQNGIRVDVADPDNLGPFLSYNESLAAIKSLLDEAAQELSSAGASFDFVLSSGFAGFDDPASFREFNRALAARIAIYQGNKGEARTALAESFLNMQGSLTTGPARIYSTGGGAQTNTVFRPTNQAEALVAHPDFIADLAPNDARNAKIQERDEPISLDGLSSTHDVVVFPSLESPIPYINNEELILLMAEANIGNDNQAAVDALNVIRTTNGLDPYDGATDDAALVDELLEQRRFSLFGLGHRWVDMRRYDRLDELPIDRQEDDVWVQLPRPVSEIQ